MLYLSTRDHRDAYTAHRALVQDRAGDGGLFVPFHLTPFSGKELDALLSLPSGQITAEILNLFFGKRLSCFDVEFTVGKLPVRVRNLGNRISVAEFWHVPGEEFAWSCQKLSHKLLESYGISFCSEWFPIALRTAMLFGVFGLLRKEGKSDGADPVDISLNAGNLSDVLAVWYARQLGLPVGNILCCCADNSSLWELLHQGSMRTDRVGISSCVSSSDTVLPPSLERLIFAAGGFEETYRYLHACRTGSVYRINPALRRRLGEGMEAPVVTSGRIPDAASNIFSTYSVLLGPDAVLSYTGLLDYRSITGISRRAIILSDRAPGKDVPFFLRSLPLSPEQLREHIDTM